MASLLSMMYSGGGEVFAEGEGFHAESLPVSLDFGEVFGMSGELVGCSFPPAVAGVSLVGALLALRHVFSLWALKVEVLLLVLNGQASGASFIAGGVGVSSPTEMADEALSSPVGYVGLPVHQAPEPVGEVLCVFYWMS